MTVKPKTRAEIDKEYPVAITLRFKSDDEKKDFMTGLSDGWGENSCSLAWPWGDGASFDDVVDYGVDVFERSE